MEQDKVRLPCDFDFIRKSQEISEHLALGKNLVPVSKTELYIRQCNKFISKLLVFLATKA
jgi:hypothetical protein